MGTTNETTTQVVFEVRDHGYNVLAWSESEENARRAAEEIDENLDAPRVEDRAVLIKEVGYDPARHHDHLRS